MTLFIFPVKRLEEINGTNGLDNHEYLSEIDCTTCIFDLYYIRVTYCWKKIQNTAAATAMILPLYCPAANTDTQDTA